MNKLDIFQNKMRKHQLKEDTIKIFAHYYKLLINGEKGKLTKNEIELPDGDLVLDYDSLNDENYENLKKLAVIKLNGGLGTSMGLSKAKSLLPVKDGLSFLDIIVKQTLNLRNKYNTILPLIFMNSFNTSADTLDFLKKYPDIKTDDLPLDFLQSKFPKVIKNDLTPLETSIDNQNWNPPGHGDIYSALESVELIDKLINKGIEYIFVSNSDNLGAIVDPKILNKMISEKISFVMEVCNRTEMDKKGGHLAKTKDGRLILREVAQCPDDEIDEFQDINTYRYFNTNNLWIYLPELKKLMDDNNGFLPLPLILNEKKVEDIPVYQFETAMGSAISLFKKSKAICVPRNRFLPVKKNQDLLILWSDIYDLNKDYILSKNPDSKEIILNLDNDYYGKIDQLKEACQKGIPSLKDCESLNIKGYLLFDKNVKFSGKVDINTECKNILKDIHIKGY